MPRQLRRRVWMMPRLLKIRLMAVELAGAVWSYSIRVRNHSGNSVEAFSATQQVLTFISKAAGVKNVSGNASVPAWNSMAVRRKEGSRLISQFLAASTFCWDSPVPANLGCSIHATRWQGLIACSKRFFSFVWCGWSTGSESSERKMPQSSARLQLSLWALSRAMAIGWSWLIRSLTQRNMPTFNTFCAICESMSSACSWEMVMN